MTDDFQIVEEALNRLAMDGPVTQAEFCGPASAALARLREREAQLRLAWEEEERAHLAVEKAHYDRAEAAEARVASLEDQISTHLAAWEGANERAKTADARVAELEATLREAKKWLVVPSDIPAQHHEALGRARAETDAALEPEDLDGPDGPHARPTV